MGRIDAADMPTKVELEHAFQARTYLELDVRALDDLGATAFRNRSRRTLVKAPSVAPTFDPLSSPTFFKRLHRGYPRGGSTLTHEEIVIAVITGKSQVPRCSTADGSTRRPARAAAALRCVSSHGSRWPKGKADTSSSYCAAKAVPNLKPGRGVHSVEAFVWGHTTSQPKKAGLDMGCCSVPPVRPSTTSQLQCNKPKSPRPAFSRGANKVSNDIWGQMSNAPQASAARVHRSQMKRSNDTHKGGHIKTDFMLRDLEYCQAMRTPRRKREAFFRQYHGMDSAMIKTPRVESWRARISHLPQMLQFSQDRTILESSGIDQQSKNDRAKRVVQIALETRSDLVMRVVLFRLLYAKNVLSVLQRWQVNLGLKTSSRQGFHAAVKAAKCLGTSRAVVQQWKAHEIEHVILTWFNKMKHRKRGKMKHAEEVEKIINTEQQADDMMIGIQLMIERSYSKEIGNSSLLATELLTAFKDHPKVEPEFAEWLLGNHEENFKRFEVEIQCGVKLCGLRAAARTYLEQLHTNTTITHYEPSKKKKPKTRKAVNQRMFRKWCSVIDSWLERIGWPAGRSLTSRFIQFGLIARVEPWRTRGLVLFKQCVLQLLFAARLVSGRKNYRKSTKSHKKPLSKAQLRKARTMFDRFDINGVGYLTPEDLIRVLSCMGVEATLYHVQHGKPSRACN